MDKTQSADKSTNKTSSAPQVEQKQKPPEKQSEPVQLARALATQNAASSTGQPPGGGSASQDNAAQTQTQPADRQMSAPARARTANALQGSVGNARLSRMLGATVQAQLTVNTPGDIFEQEADHVAENVTQRKREPGQAAAISRVPAGDASSINRETPQNKEKGHSNVEVDTAMQARIQSPTGGQPLSEGMRQEMEPGLGTDLSNVRVHDNSDDKADADRLNAKAFTHGSDIWIGSAGSAADRRLMAHELTHTVQQGAARPEGTSIAVQREENSTSAIQSQAPIKPVPWTGDAVSMANALRNLLVAQEIDRIADSLNGLWIRDIVDTLRMLKLDPGAFAAITAATRFKTNPRLVGALDVVEGRSPGAAGILPDQAIELRAMHDAPDWPRIIGPQSPPKVLVNPDTLADPVLSDPRYYAALYDAIRRNRALASQYLLRTVKPRPADRVPGGYVYVGPSQKGDQPGGLDVPDPKRKAVNEAIWKELGVGEGTQATINTWDSARFTFGPGFAATGLLRRVMDNLAKSGSEVLTVLRNAGVMYQNNTWVVVDPDSQSVKYGAEALQVMSRNVSLISTFLDTAGDPAMRRQWMEAEWGAMHGSGGAANVPDQVVMNWPVDLIVFVAHCVHWGGLTWKDWDNRDPPSLFDVVRKQAGHVPRQKDDPRILTWLSANTFLSFSGGLLLKTMRERGRRQGIAINLPDDWKTAFVGAVALPASTTTPVYHIIEAGER
jgi:hypothetical protein